MRPPARRDGLVVRDLSGETIVYDRERHQAHCLNRTAALVFRHADGTRSAHDIATLLGEGEPCEHEATVALALEQLSQAGLLDGAEAVRDPARRAALRQVGLGAALLLPAIASVLAPTPAEAATCVTSCVGQPDGTPCNCFAPTVPCSSAVCTAIGCSDGGGC
jgi:hypothetical protein